MSALCHFYSSFQDSSMLQHVSEFHSFLRLNNSSVLSIQHILFMHTCHWMNGFGSIFWLLWITLVWICVYKYVFKCLLSFEYIPRSGIVKSYGTSVFKFWGTAILYSIAAISFYILTNSAQKFQFFHIFNDLLFSGFLIIDILVDVK